MSAIKPPFPRRYPFFFWEPEEVESIQAVVGAQAKPDLDYSIVQQDLCRRVACDIRQIIEKLGLPLFAHR